MKTPYTTSFQGKAPRPITVVRNWTLERLLTAAAPYSNRASFAKSARFAYKAAKEQGVLDIVCRNMPY